MTQQGEGLGSPLGGVRECAVGLGLQGCGVGVCSGHDFP